MILDKRGVPLEVRLKKDGEGQSCDPYAGRGDAGRECPVCKKTVDQIWLRASRAVLTWCPCGHIFIGNPDVKDRPISLFTM